MSDKLKKADIAALVAEREQIGNWLKPPAMPKTEDQLREEAILEAWAVEGRKRLAEIDAALNARFFPNPKEEGTERKTLYGFAAMRKGIINRAFDLPSLAVIVANAQSVADEMGITFQDEDGQPCTLEECVIEWKPSLKLTPYRNLPKPIRDIFDNALIATPKADEFEIVRMEDGDE